MGFTAEKPRWKVKTTTDDVVPGRISIDVELDDGAGRLCHIDNTLSKEQIEEELDKVWITYSQSDAAKAKRKAEGKEPKVKTDDFPTGLVDKDHRGS